MVKVDMNIMAQYLTDKKYGYWDSSLEGNLDFIKRRFFSVEVQKNITITLDCEINYYDVGNLLNHVLNFVNEDCKDYEGCEKIYELCQYDVRNINIKFV